MLCIATTIHDPAALTSICRRIQAPAEHPRGNGYTWCIRLSGLNAPITVNTLTGVVIYDRRDNGFGRYGRIMRFIHRVYHAQAERRLAQAAARPECCRHTPDASATAMRKRRRLEEACVAARTTDASFILEVPMSHIVNIQTRLNDSVAIGAACRRLNLAEPTQGTARLYSGEVTGLLVQLPGWTYPVVIDTASGIAKLDNFEGHWGDREHFDRFLQIYAVERAKQEARKKGHQVSEQALADGSIKVQIIEGTA